MCSQLSTMDETSDLRQMLAYDVDQKEHGFNAMALRKMLIRTAKRLAGSLSLAFSLIL